MTRGKKLGDFIGKNEKTKIICKLQKVNNYIALYLFILFCIFWSNCKYVIQDYCVDYYYWLLCMASTNRQNFLNILERTWSTWPRSHCQPRRSKGYDGVCIQETRRNEGSSSWHLMLACVIYVFLLNIERNDYLNVLFMICMGQNSYGIVNYKELN